MADEKTVAEPGWEVVSDADVATEGTANAETVTADKAEEERVALGKRAEKRIRDLVKRAKAAEERAEAAHAQLNGWETKFSNLENEIKSLKQGTQANGREAIQGRYAAAKRALAAAKETGNTAAEIEAIEAMTAAQADWRLLGSAPKTEEPRREDVRQVRQPPEGGGLHPKAKRWIDSQEWWDDDDARRGAAIAIAQKLEREGYDPTDDEHYEELDKRLSERFADKTTDDEVVERPRARQVVSGGTRASPATNGRTKVKLTDEHVRLANKWGIPLEQMAREVHKMDSAKKADGTGYHPVEIDIPQRGAR